MVVLGPLGSEPSVSADSTTRASNWCSVSESNRSLALERRGVSPETQRNVAIVRRLELRKPGLRGLLLEPLCIHDHVGGAHRNRTDQAICLQGRSGFLARTPNSRLVTPTTRPARIRWPRLPATFTVGTAGWTRTTFSPLKRRDSSPLSYDGMGWCSVLESNQAGRFGREGYSLAGVRPRLTLRLVPGA